MKASQPGQPFSGRTIWIRKLQTPLREFLRTETGGASVLLSAAIAALVWVNVDASSYDALWGTTLSIDVGGAGVALDLRHWVNSGLMTFFFFVLGLEARREFDGSFLQRGFSSPITSGSCSATSLASRWAFSARRGWWRG
ncbi:MAG: Na+/H+ antiporter NhaA [Rubrobacter sp.]